MRRKDREISDREDMLDVLRRCDTIRVAMVSEGAPYIVPISFGIEAEEGRPVALYFHCARTGRKAEALAQNPRVCVEADIFYKTESTPHGITARYESIIGFGSAHPVEGEEKQRGLRCLLEHYGYTSYPLDSCAYLPATAVYKITLDSLTGKRNLPQET